jgi:hypothetical protein
MNKKGLYTWSDHKDDTLWNYDRFDSELECVADAKKNGKKTGDVIAIGTCEEFIPTVDAEEVLESVEMDAYETVGEAAEGWLPYSQTDILQERLSKVLNEWLVETHQEPTFYHITNIRTVVIL